MSDNKLILHTTVNTTEAECQVANICPFALSQLLLCCLLVVAIALEKIEDR